MSAERQPSGLVLPGRFPDALFEAINERLATKIPIPSSEWDNLAGGHNAVRYRLRGCADYSAEFVECVSQAGDAPAPEHRYQQERQLFGFFVSGIAALDSFSFFLYFTAAHIRPGGFPAQQPGQIKKINLKSTADAFLKAFPQEQISTLLNDLVNDSMFKEWSDLRNVLAHRASPGRSIYASIGCSVPDPAADWRIDPARNLKIDINLTPPRLVWLVEKLEGLVLATDQFIQKYF